MKKKMILYIVSLILSGIIISCPNPWVRDLTDPLFKKKDPQKIQGFEWIRSGTYTMGSSDSADNGADPPHQVTLTNGFYMGKYQVTQEQWETVMTGNSNGIPTTPSYFTTANSEPPALGEAEKKRPVEMVSWYDVLVFCNRLSRNEGLTPVYSISGSTNPNDWGNAPTVSNDPTWDAVAMDINAKGYRLPTEAEWEYVSRAGIDPYEPYNPEWDGVTAATAPGWYWDNSNSDGSGQKTHEVGKRAANSWGLYDMHGNVYEWCWDWYDDYATGGNPETDPTGPFSGTYRMIRGGSWDLSAGLLRSAYRDYNYPGIRYNYVGFRLVRGL